MQQRLFVIDAMAMAFRNYHAFGANQLKTSSGLPTSAVFGSMNFLLKLIEDEKPDYLVVATDSRQKTFRHERYEAYKANRSEMPEDLAVQLPYLFELFEAMDIKLLKEGGLEADDLIGSLVSQWAGPALHCYIVSGDKDFMQLIGPHISLYSPKKGGLVEVINAEGVHNKFACRPEQVIDILAMIGDSSDNVPGVPGIGDKGAKELIAAFGSLDAVYAQLDRVANKRLRTALENGRDMAYLSRDLVTIKRDAPLHFSLNDYLVPETATANPALLAIAKKLEFRLVVDRMEKRLQERGLSLASSGGSEPAVRRYEDEADRLNYRICRTAADLDELVQILTTVERFAYDTETTGLDIVSDRPIGLSFGVAEGVAWYAPLVDKHLQGLSPDVVMTRLAPFLVDPSKLKIGHNSKFDIEMLANIGLPVAAPLADTMIAAYLLDSTERGYGLDALCRKYLNYEKIKTTSLIGADASLSMLDAHLEDLGRYACEDADFTLRLWEKLQTAMHDMGLETVFRDVEMPLVPILAGMERTGVYVDVDILMQFSAELDARAKALTAEIHHLAGEAFNINSTKQLQTILFEKLKVHEVLGLKRVKKTKSGYSTDVSVLEAMVEHALPRALLDYRMVTKLKSTYVDALPQLIRPKTGRIHTSFHQTGTATGRLSSSDPNLQNIPIRSELGREIRKAFRATGPDSCIVSADYSQVELRLLAHLADEENLIQAFREGQDIHTATAARIFSVSPEAVSPEHRSQAKAINFGLIYGMGPQRLARSTGVSVAEAKDFIQRYFATYPRIRTYIDQAIAFAKEHEYTQTMLGRRRPLPEISGKDALALANAQNIAVNSPVQGSAADLIKLAMIKIQKKLDESPLRAKMLMQVHDELVFECHTADTEALMALVKEAMETAKTLRVPLVAEVAAGRDWLEAH